ncbi:hypothetical protein H7J08_12795 [Mycobacterium frederiksbergense]|uniref:hypothetical protein n=1 Tax=Mycobacteriaceae TaxID=1762 RepID=UPI0021F2C021|nr:hypothetical protein [Mycolicibacterium frederiksbergense]MBX9920645.1 hypothetical protein [Mycolicibacterium frederiksbergense]MCV7045542.1 hypothetical protein [Mycolicibacterium frederiksbergense]
MKQCAEGARAFARSYGGPVIHLVRDRDFEFGPESGLTGDERTADTQRERATHRGDRQAGSPKGAQIEKWKVSRLNGQSVIHRAPHSIDAATDRAAADDEQRSPTKLAKGE